MLEKASTALYGLVLVLALTPQILCPQGVRYALEALLVVLLFVSSLFSPGVFRIGLKHVIVSLLFIAVAAASACVSLSVVQWRSYFVPLAECVGLVLATGIVVRDKRTLSCVGWILVLTGVAGAIPAIVSSSLGQFLALEVRYGGPYAQPNIYSAALIPHIAAGLLLIGTARRRSVKFLLILATVSMVFGDLLTGSRSGLLVLAAVLAYAFLKVAKRRALTVVLALGVLTALVIALPPQLRLRIVALPGVSAVQVQSLPNYAGLMGNTTERLHASLVSLRIFADHPWGVGLGNTALYYPTYVNDAIAPPVAAHNMYVTVLTELGLQGLATFLGLALIVLLELRRQRRKAIAEGSWRDAQTLIVFLTCVTWAWLLGGLTGTDYLFLKPYYIVLGLVASSPAIVFISGRESKGNVSCVE